MTRDQDTDELNDICHRLMHVRDLDIDEVQELYYRKNFLESVIALVEDEDES